MKKITIPAAGEIDQIKMDGLGIYVMPGAPTYNNIEDYPTISFDSPGGNTYPLGPGATWGYQRCGFGDIFIKGTDASAGSELYILPLATCPTPGMSADPGILKQSECGQSFSVDATDLSESFTEAQLMNDDLELPVQVEVQARDNPIAYAFDTAPDQAGFGKVLVPPVVPDDPAVDNAVPGDLVRITGIDHILKFQWIAAVNTFQGSLIVTPTY